MTRAALHRLLAGLAACGLGLPGPARAQEVAPRAQDGAPRAVVELFTSQGCSPARRRTGW